MSVFNRVTKLVVISTTGLCLLGGGVLIWASQSWYVFVWAEAQSAFPDAGVKVVMVNTAATTHLRENYSLPAEVVNTISLRALIVDKEDHCVATVGREGLLENNPQVRIDLDLLSGVYLSRIHVVEKVPPIGD